jgi:hypothetical protein
MSVSLDEKKKREFELRRSLDEVSNNALRKSIENDYKLKIVEWESRNGKLLMVLCLGGLVAGAVIAGRGLILWSLRVQVFQDAILKKQAEATEQQEA